MKAVASVTKVALRGLLSRKLRSVLTGFAVVIGVAFVVGTLVFTDTIDESFKNLFERTQQGVDVVRRGAPGGQGRLLGAADDARRHAGEGQGGAGRGASPRAACSSDGTLLDKQGKAIVSNGPPTLIVSSLDREGLPGPRLRRAAARPQTADEVAIDRGTAKKYGFKVGDTVDRLRRRAGQAVHGLRHRHARRQGQPRRRAAGRDDAARGAAR